MFVQKEKQYLTKHMPPSIKKLLHTQEIKTITVAIRTKNIPNYGNHDGFFWLLEDSNDGPREKSDR